MKKKLLVLLLVFTTVFALVGCGGGNNKKPSGVQVNLTYKGYEDKTYSADIYYPEDSTLTFEDKSTNSKRFSNADANYMMDVYLYQDTTYAENKDTAASKYDEYSDFTVGDYTGYGYKNVFAYKIFILLEQVGNTYVYMTFTIEQYNFDKSLDYGAALYQNTPELQTIVNSIVYNGVVE